GFQPDFAEAAAAAPSPALIVHN
ncbi:MAG: hypothetical protein QOC54_1508, partial [Baekduia sp.]|nr:hypothetical protein [Baekduia sp.]